MTSGSNPVLGERLSPGGHPLRLCFIGDPRSIHTVRWMRFFSERGHQVALIAQAKADPVPEVEAFYLLSPRSALPGTRILRNVLEVRKALRGFRPHVLHAHYINECGWLGAMSGFHPFVLTAWGSDVYLAGRASRLARILTPWTVRQADYVTADSQHQILRLRRMGAPAKLTEMVTWGVDRREFTGGGGDEWRRRHGIGLDRTVILSPRRWIPNSNIEVVVEAFARLHREEPRAVLVLKHMADADNAFKARIEARVQALGIAEATRVVDELPAHELPAMYATADITVSVCSSDGTPVSVLEAMASGSTVIGSDLPSLGEWIEHEVSGVLVPARDVERLAAQLGRLCADPALRRRLAERAIAVVTERADRTRNLERVEMAYRLLAAGAGDASRGRREG